MTGLSSIVYTSNFMQFIPRISVYVVLLKIWRSATRVWARVERCTPVE